MHASWNPEALPLPPRSGAWKLQAALVGLGVLWLSGIGLGSAWFMNYERRPGRDSAVRERWPEESRLERLPGSPTLILLAHPQCPCTRASLDELADLVGRAPVSLRSYVLFLNPSDLPPTWTHSALWDQAQIIPGVCAIDDPEGREARLFGGTTSGHVLLYDAQGTLRFSGGITAARGTRGESAGKDSILSYFTRGSSPFLRTHVFGCPLENGDQKR